MRTMIRVPHNLSVCAAAAILAACRGSAQLPNPAAETPLRDARTAKQVSSPSFPTRERVGSDSFSTETLSGSAEVDCHASFDNSTFSASGTASGPYPGTFAAKGYWGPNPQGYYFAGSFKIRSGASKISGTIGGFWFYGKRFHGTCATFGPNVAQYSANSVQGKVKVKISNRFHAAFSRF
jgi:hypothetical protein